MPHLSIKNFSCIDFAEMELKPVTILIGKQASGKSIISKLFHFLSTIYRIMYDDAEQQNPLRVFQKNLSKAFALQFPITAWGNKDFIIEYKCGPVSITIERKINKNSSSEEATVKISEFLSAHYNTIVKNYGEIKRETEDDEFTFIARSTTWPIQRESIKVLRNILKREYVASQIFIPAGRSFFSNLGKAATILEHGSQLDDVTKQFGRMFTALLDGRYRPYFGEKPSSRIKEFLKYQKHKIQEIFGGEIKLSQNDTHVSTPDGRKIPLSIMSSGQQELFPLILLMQYYTSEISEKSETGTDIMYVEEPEAHLFPATQGHLTQHLVEIANFNQDRARLLITSHSPYVLSTLNNLIKAHEVGAQSKINQTLVAEIVPSSAWLSPHALGAYALQDGTLVNIQDESGLIDATYLDGISAEITDVFMQLLEIEAIGA